LVSIVVVINHIVNVCGWLSAILYDGLNDSREYMALFNQHCSNRIFTLGCKSVLQNMTVGTVLRYPTLAVMLHIYYNATSMGAKTQAVINKRRLYWLPYTILKKMNFENSEFHVVAYTFLHALVTSCTWCVHILYLLVIIVYDEFVSSLPEDVLTASDR